MHACLLTVFFFVAFDEGHQANPVLNRLQETGIAAPGDEARKFPKFSMEDGLTAEQQVDLIRQLGGRTYPYETFIRKSYVAPEIYHEEKDPVGKSTVYRHADFWFVAYGDLESLKDKDFLESLLGGTDKKDAKASREITAEDLKKRNIEMTFPDREGFGYATVDILEIVELSTAGWSCWSETKDSLVVAAMSDPRFNDDPEFPNQWRPLRRNDPPSPFVGGTGVYLKMTKLHQPAGAIFIEGHLKLAELYVWFAGTNRLGSKLRIGVQNQVRSLRRELAKASR